MMVNTLTVQFAVRRKNTMKAAYANVTVNTILIKTVIAYCRITVLMHIVKSLYQIVMVLQVI